MKRTHPPRAWLDDRPMVRVAPMESLMAQSRVERFDSSLERARMLQEHDAIIREARSFMESEGLSQADLAKMAGYSSGVISDLFKGSYQGDVAGVLHKVAAAIAAARDRKAAPGKGEFVTTAVAKEIFAVLKTVATLEGISVIYGPARIGKSITLNACLKLDYPNAIYLQINDKSRTPTALYHALMAKLGRRQGKTGWNVARAFAWISEQLTGSHRMIIVDEAENARVDTLNSLRQLHDETGCPILLAGRPPLLAKVKNTTSDGRIGGSLLGRLTIVRDLTARTRQRGGGEPLFSVEEVVQVLARQKVRLARDARRWATALANIVALGDEREGCGLGYIKNLAVLAAHANGKAEEITLAMLQECNELLLGNEYASMMHTEVEQYLERATG